MSDTPESSDAPVDRGTAQATPSPEGRKMGAEVANAASDTKTQSDTASESKGSPTDKKPAGDTPSSREQAPSNDPAPSGDKKVPAPAAASERKPRIGDSRPAPATDESSSGEDADSGSGSDSASSDAGNEGTGGSRSGRRRRRRRGGGGGGQGEQQGQSNQRGGDRDTADGKQSGSGRSDNRDRRDNQDHNGEGGAKKGGRRRNRGRRGQNKPVSQNVPDEAIELDEETLKQRRGRSRKGRPVGRYLMVVSRRADATHIAILEGRTLIEYYVSRPTDNVFQIHGNIYLGRVQNVLPGMEAAFVDIGTPKNAVIYRGDVQYQKDDFEGSSQPRIEQLIKARQPILCQVTKNPIAHKGARLTTEVSLPGRFVVLVPNSDTYGISKRLPDDERKRLRNILDKARPKGHGIIVRTAAENVTAQEIERDIAGLVKQWKDIEALANRSKAPALLYQEPDMSTRIIREEFNKEYRGVVLDDRDLHAEVADYVSSITPALADRIEYYDPSEERLPLFERFHVHEQLHKALDRKVWLPSGGSLIIESTEALTVIDVNTGKNVGSSNLEDTVFRNNLEAADVIAQQLRLRDIGGIIVIDFVDMESKKNRNEVIKAFRAALARDKTRTQVYDISELGLAEMTRKRIGEGLLESLSVNCPHCEGRGIRLSDDEDR
jgi:ribonuclease E